MASTASSRARALLDSPPRRASGPAEPRVAEASTQTEPSDSWLIVESQPEVRSCLDAVLLESETSKESLANCERVIEDLSKELESYQTAARGHSTGSVATPMELAYMVLRTPDALSHLRGHHRTTLAGFLNRLGLSPEDSRAGFYIRHFESQAKASDMWRHQPLAPPYPVDLH